MRSRFDDPSVAPDGFFCSSPAVGVRWLHADGRLEYVRCGASNRCDYCAMLTACENAVVLRLDAFRGAMPTLGVTTTTASSTVNWDALRRSEQNLWRALRRDFGRVRVQYCGLVEWSTGRAASSGGVRRPHIHHTVKGLTRDDVREWVAGCGRCGICREGSKAACRESKIARRWLSYSGDAWRVECRELITPMAAVAYMVLHHHKREQGPPPGTRNVKRIRPSQGYFCRPIAELRAEARELLMEERVYSALVSILDAPSGTPLDLVEELIAGEIDGARARAREGRPRLCHVKERRVVDRSTGEVGYRFEKVLRVLST